MEVYSQLTHPIALTIFVLTLLFPIVVGFVTLRKTKDQEDFFVGGRAMDKFVVALSAVSSGRSAWLVLGFSGLAYKLGTAAVWALVGYICVEMLQFIYIGRKLRAHTATYGSITLLDYFASRFNDSKLLRITGATIIILFLTAYVAAQFNAGAKSLNTALGIPFIWCLFISAFLILVYMVLGGYIAVAYNDVIRAVIMLVGLVVLPICALVEIGGFSYLLGILHKLHPKYLDPFSVGMGAIIGFLGIGLGSPGQPHIVVRYMSIDDADKLRFSAVIGTFWNVIMGWGALFIGLVGRAIIPVTDKLPNQDPEMIYLVLSAEFFGPIIYGLLVGGIFAAILSTADSQLLVVASTFVRDVYEKIACRESVIEEKRKLLISRAVVICAGLLALILAYVGKGLIFWLVLFAWGGLGASLGPAIILSLYWQNTHKYGIFAGMVTGTVVTIVWKTYFKALTGIYELIPAFIGSIVVILIVSIICNAIVPQPNEDNI